MEGFVTLTKDDAKTKSYVTGEFSAEYRAI